MKRTLGWLGLLLALIGSVAPSLVGAQAQIESAFSDELISQLGYPLVEVHVGRDGIDAPQTLAPGLYQIRLSADEPYVGYVNIVQAPAGLDEKTAEEQMLAAGAGDLPQPGWTYFGGTNTPGPGETATFVIDLEPGEYQIAASYYTANEGNDEVMRLAPLTVGGEATPAASPVAVPVASPVVMSGPAADVTLTMTDDLQYLVAPDAITTGPHIWKIENTGTERAHHVVIFRIPEGYTDEEIVAEYQKLMSGPEPGPDSFVAQIVWSGYAAMQSGGTVTWAEFDFKPGTYAAICFIMDDEQSMPHVMDGMFTQFTVQ